MIFLCTDTILSKEQHSRLKRQINRTWPKDKPRPILLEGGLRPVFLPESDKDNEN